MNELQLLLPCAAGVEDFLAAEVQRITGATPRAWRGGVLVEGSGRDALLLNLHSRLAQRVLMMDHGKIISDLSSAEYLAHFAPADLALSKAA